MTTSDDPTPKFFTAPQGMSWRVRAVLVLIFLTAFATIYVSNWLLTERFTASANQRTQLRLAFYSGNLLSELKRNAIVPRILSGDPQVIGELNSGDFQLTSQRLIALNEELGSAGILLLDADGRVVAATDRNRIGMNLRQDAQFVAAVRSDKTVFTVNEREANVFDFSFSRKIESNSQLIGALVIEVDLRKFQTAWANVSDTVIVTQSDGRVVVSSAQDFMGLTEQQAMQQREIDGVWERALRATRDLTAQGGEGPYIEDLTLLRQELAIPFQGWHIVGFAPYAGVRQRVNAVLALEIMGFALLIALAFYFLSRKSMMRAFFAQRESADLRQLNNRLQREITEREKVEKNLQVAEQSLAQSSKLAALGEMSAAVSHELNQPLAAMKTYLAGARLLLDRKRPDEALNSFQRMDDLIGRMGAITRQLKSYARKGGEDFVPVDVCAAVRATLDIMSPQLSARQVLVTCPLPDDAVLVFGDQLRLEQVFVNLLRNALDATITTPQPEIEILLVVGEWVTLTVRDNGDGIGDLEGLFEPFYTTKQPGDGIGLGLAISSGIVDDFGGRLTARNGTTGGAVFEVTLPKYHVD